MSSCLKRCLFLSNHNTVNFIRNKLRPVWRIVYRRLPVFVKKTPPIITDQNHRIMQMCMVAHPECEVVVSSYGGVMTTAFERWLKRYKNVNTTYQPSATGYASLKHALYPLISANRQLRLVYLFDDPLLSLLSIFSRFNMYERCNHLIHTTHDLSYRKLLTRYKLSSLKRYLNSDKGVFPMQLQFHNWQTGPTQHPILLIRSSAVWNHLDLVQSFLGLPDEAMASFPEKKERRSSPEDLDPALRDRFNKLYGDFQEEIKCQPDVRIRRANWFDS